jgi:putative transcriptional regulator
MDQFDKLFHIDNNDFLPAKGKVLLAEPFLEGKYFKRSVVLLADENEEGFVGFVLNKPINLTIDDLIVSIDNYEGNVFIGGPVEEDKVYYIHTIPDLIPNSIPIFDNLYWGGDFQIIKDLLDQKMIIKDQIRFFVGYAGWSPGQLEDEILTESWLVSKISVDEIMTLSSDDLWKRSVEKLGGKYKLWSNFPENPKMN